MINFTIHLPSNSPPLARYWAHHPPSFTKCTNGESARERKQFEVAKKSIKREWYTISHTHTHKIRCNSSTVKSNPAQWGHYSMCWNQDHPRPCTAPFLLATDPLQWRVSGPTGAIQRQSGLRCCSTAFCPLDHDLRESALPVALPDNYVLLYPPSQTSQRMATSSLRRRPSLWSPPASRLSTSTYPGPVCFSSLQSRATLHSFHSCLHLPRHRLTEKNWDLGGKKFHHEENRMSQSFHLGEPPSYLSLL